MAILDRAAYLFFVFLIYSILSGCSSEDLLRYGIMKPEKPETIDAVGYAVIDAQPGPSYEEKLLQAMKASRATAYELLVEQVYGRRISVNNSYPGAGDVRSYSSSSLTGELAGFTTVTHGIDGKLYATHLSIDAKKAEEIYEYYSGGEKKKESWWH